MYRSDLRLKCLLKKKRFTTFSFSKNNNDSIYRFLKNAVYIRFFNVNYSSTLSLFCPTKLRKYNLRKCVNTFKVINQASVNKHNPTCCRMRYCGMRCFIPIATDMTKKILLGELF